MGLSTAVCTDVNRVSARGEAPRPVRGGAGRGLAAAARGTRASDTTQETERITFHVERRWIEAIRRQADLDGLTITQVVNQAFRQHFDSQ